MRDGRTGRDAHSLLPAQLALSVASRKCRVVVRASFSSTRRSHATQRGPRGDYVIQYRTCTYSPALYSNCVSSRSFVLTTPSRQLGSDTQQKTTTSQPQSSPHPLVLLSLIYSNKGLYTLLQLLCIHSLEYFSMVYDNNVMESLSKQADSEWHH